MGYTVHVRSACVERTGVWALDCLLTHDSAFNLHYANKNPYFAFYMYSILFFKYLQIHLTLCGLSRFTACYELMTQRRWTYLGSKGASERGFMESLHSDLNTKNASFCVTCENLTGPLWLVSEVEELLPSTDPSDLTSSAPSPVTDSSWDTTDLLSSGTPDNGTGSVGVCGALLFWSLSSTVSAVGVSCSEWCSWTELSCVASPLVDVSGCSVPYSDCCRALWPSSCCWPWSAVDRSGAFHLTVDWCKMQMTNDGMRWLYYHVYHAGYT